MAFQHKPPWQEKERQEGDSCLKMTVIICLSLLLGCGIFFLLIG